MRVKITTVFIVNVLALAVSVLAIDAKGAEETITTTPLFIPASDLKWSDLDLLEHRALRWWTYGATIK